MNSLYNCISVLQLSLIIYTSCSETIECGTIDEELVTTDTRTTRTEGTARVVANFGGIYNYNWNNGRTILQIENLEAGNYCVTISTALQPECETVLYKEVLS